MLSRLGFAWFWNTTKILVGSRATESFLDFFIQVLSLPSFPPF